MADALEAAFKKRVLNTIREMFPGCEIIHNPANYRKGIPDTTILYGDRWVLLEFKKSATASKRPNQDYHVERLNNMGYAAFIYPENEGTILDEIQRALSPRG